MNTSDFTSINDVLDFSIETELKAFNLYTKLANQSNCADLQKVFLGVAEDSMQHKMQLEEIKKTKTYTPESNLLSSLKKSDLEIHNRYARDITYSQALLLAIRREKSCHTVYEALAQNAPTEQLRELFLDFSNDESRHIGYFEQEYTNSLQPVQGINA